MEWENISISNSTLNLDIATFRKNINFECKKPKGHVPEDVLLGLWRVIYWTSQFLTWICLPLMQSYSKAGEFTALGRFKSAIYNNTIYYGIYGFIFIILLFYALSKGVSLNLYKFI